MPLLSPGYKATDVPEISVNIDITRFINIGYWGAGGMHIGPHASGW